MLLLHMYELTNTGAVAAVEERFLWTMGLEIFGEWKIPVKGLDEGLDEELK